MAPFRVDEVVRMVRVVFLHPDLGIGGAERLIVDCSLALQSKVWRSVLYVRNGQLRVFVVLTNVGSYQAHIGLNTFSYQLVIVLSFLL